jgi:hypothetical protein
MSITIHPELEAKMRERAEAEGGRSLHGVVSPNPGSFTKPVISVLYKRSGWSKRHLFCPVSGWPEYPYDGQVNATPSGGSNWP